MENLRYQRSVIMTGYDDGLQEGRAEGRAEGEKDAKIEMALKLLNLGIGIDTIVAASGLTKEEVEKLK